MTTVRVTWTDDQEDSYTCDHLTSEGGVLYLHLSGEQMGSKIGIPVANVRVFTVERP